MPQIRIVDKEIRLVPYYRNDDVSLKWYQDPDVCRQVDNIDHVYDIELLHKMYDFLVSNGECWYIEYRGRLVGDISLRNNAEVAIVISKEYQNMHIGRRCVLNLLRLAEEKGMSQVRANIYSFNEQSRAMFRSVGFSQESDEWFVYDIGKDI